MILDFLIDQNHNRGNKLLSLETQFICVGAKPSCICGPFGTAFFYSVWGRLAVFGNQGLKFSKLCANRILKQPRENRKDKGITFANLGAHIILEARTVGANNLFPIMRLLAQRENGIDKGIPYPNLGANILLEALTLGANNLLKDLIK